MKILHTSDIHIKEYEDERWNTLVKLLNTGKQEKIDVFVICGDLFNKDFNAEELRPKVQNLFSNNGFDIILLPGNHDSISYQKGYFFGDDVILLNNFDEYKEYDDMCIWGLPFEPMERKDVLTKLRLLGKMLNPQKINILLYHGELLDAVFSRKDFGDEGIERYMPVMLSDFEKLNLHYILAGHFHSKFDIRQIGPNRYFIYPGSPISIKKSEIGRRKINIFEVGESPKEYILDTPHFENVIAEFDPFRDETPLEYVETCLNEIHSNAKIILTVKGFINSEKIGMDEVELLDKINKVVAERCIDKNYEFKDVSVIIEDDLFKNFIKKLEKTDYEENKKQQMRDLTIKAMMGVFS